MKLLLRQKNELFEKIEATQMFTPSQFEIEEITGATNLIITGTEISFRGTEYSFTVMDEPRDRSFSVGYSPGDELFVEGYTAVGWDSVISLYMQWLDNLEEEVKLGDKWNRLHQEMQELMLSPTIEDGAKFTHSEFLELSKKISDIKNALPSIPLLLEQQKVLEYKLDNLLKLATDLNKFDWRSLFIGTIQSIIMQLGITPDNATLIWQAIKMVFHNYFIQ